MKTKKRIYTKEFKDEAVRLSYHRANIKELANELGIKVERIYKRRTDEKVKESGASIPLKSENLEVKQLKKALKNAELELEILKKAVHIFSKNNGKSINL